VDQAARELSTRYDFKGTNSSVELGEDGLTLKSVSEDRLKAARQVLEEKLVKRKVSLKALEFGKVEEAAGATARQVATIQAGISSDKAKEVNKLIKALGLKGIQSQTQGDQVRVTGKKRDDLQTVIAALAQNNCGPQYQAAASQQRGFFASLFGSNPILPAPDGYLSSTYRTLCVRTCDGYYFPVSFQVSASHFTDDEQTCQRLCPATEVALYTHRNPGEEIGQAVSLAGRPYRSLPTAFRYRQALDSACTCRKPGQSWAEALGGGYDTTIQRGDVIVTEESSKAMAQPRNDAQGRPIPNAGGASTAPPQAAPSDSGSGDSELLPAPVRTVGPPFVPAK